LFKYLEKHKTALVYIPLVLYWLVLLTLTTLPGEDLPDIGVVDKVNHFVAYFGLAVLLSLCLLFQTKYELLYRKSFLMTFLIIIVYGALDEIHQIFIPGRSAEVLDWTADASGALLGILIVYFLYRILKYKSVKFG
jgi:VanZ family protein